MLVTDIFRKASPHPLGKATLLALVALLLPTLASRPVLSPIAFVVIALAIALTSLVPVASVRTFAVGSNGSRPRPRKLSAGPTAGREVAK